jgi:AcrR family transcriptional regulator
MPRGEYDRGERKARTREALLAAAARVYARRGFDGATLDEVAAEAGFSKGAVYAHFGSKENLLMALMSEHLAAEVAEQVALFDRARLTEDRPIEGSERWMAHIEQDPDPFRLFVELWSYAQRDERLRKGLAEGLGLLLATFTQFAVTSAADAGVPASREACETFAQAALGLGLGLGMVKLIEPGAARNALLGGVLSLLIRALESDPQALIAGPEIAAGAR